MNKSPGRGRRPGQADTREAIRLAARQRFLADGYQAVTMRSIASHAGVDVALVSYYFGSKQGVFGAAMSITANPADIVELALQGDLASLPERALRVMLGVWDEPLTGGPLRVMASAATGDPELRRAVGEFVSRELVDRLAGRLSGPDAPARAAAFSAQIAGVIFSRYLLGIEPIASMTVDDIVRHLAPSLRVALEPQTRSRG
jgi:AcrR family transcriptional regulator